MRIIITTTGEIERQDLEKSAQSSKASYSMCSSPPLNHSKSMKNVPRYSSIFFKNNKRASFSSKEVIDKVDKDKSNVSNEELLKAKHIKINQSPISTNLINSFSEMKYDEGIQKLKKRLRPKAEEEKDVMPNFSMKVNTQTTPKLNIPIKDIINNEAYKKMMLKLRNDKIVADNNFIMQDRDFRKEVHIERNDFKMKDALSKEINRNRIDFIKYITNKRDLSPIFLRKLSLLDESKVYDLNRICQIIHSNRSKDELFKEKLNEKVRTRETLLVADATYSLNRMKSEIKMRKTMINDYQRKMVKQPMIDHCYYERTQRFWDKYKVKALQRKNNSMHKPFSNALV